MKNSLKGFKGRFQQAEGRFSKLEDRIIGIIKSEEQKKKVRLKKSKQSLKDLWDIIKWTNLLIVGVPEGKERKKVKERLFEEIMAGNLQNLMGDKKINI